MSDGGSKMITPETLRFELEGRLLALDDLGKTHVSVRYEPGPRIARVGTMLANYTWDTRMLVLEELLRFEHVHADEFAVEFDILPLEAVTDEAFAEA